MSVDHHGWLGLDPQQVPGTPGRAPCSGPMEGVGAEHVSTNPPSPAGRGRGECSGVSLPGTRPSAREHTQEEGRGVTRAQDLSAEVG